MLTAFQGQSSEPAGLESLVERLERGEFDLIAVGRALLSDPAWVRKVHQGEYGALKGFAPSAMAELV